MSSSAADAKRTHDQAFQHIIRDRNAQEEKEREELYKLQVANKRHKADEEQRQREASREARGAIPWKSCGAYNHTGCKLTATECRFVHRYDLRAGKTYYHNILPALQAQRGLQERCHYPVEFKDLRMRGKMSLTNSERLLLAKMPLLESKKKPTTAKDGDQPR